MVSMNWSLCVLLAVTLYQPSRALTDRPLVGILAQEYWHTGSVNQSYIAASYVKFVESAGARVVPVMINETDEYYKTIVDETNGLLIPGGGQDLHTSGFANAGRALLKYAQANLTRHYPIWSTCLGFELISQLMSNTTALGDCDTDDVSLPLNMTPGFMDSRLFSGADPTIVNILTEEAVTYNHHKRCLTLEAYQASDLKNKFKILSTNTDGKGVEFVSTWESVSGDPPIYGVQWHPEKNAYEFDPHKHFAHTFSAVRIGQYMANYFVNECRKTWTPSISQKSESSLLIYNYEPLYSASKTGSYTYEQIYVFNITHA